MEIKFNLGLTHLFSYSNSKIKFQENNKLKQVNLH